MQLHLTGSRRPGPRALRVLWAALAIGPSACHGTSTIDPPDGGAVAVGAPQCPGERLAAGPTATITTPDPVPAYLALASSPSDDRYLAVWADGGGTINGVPIPELVWTSVLQVGATGVQSSTVVKLTGDGDCPAAVRSGTGFAVVWGDDTGVRLQRVDAAGRPVGTTTEVAATTGRACPTSLISTSGGLTVGWIEGEGQLRERVALVGASGGATAQVLLATIGPGVAGGVALAELRGVTSAAFVEWPGGAETAAVSELDWSKIAASSPRVMPGFLSSFGSARDRLWLTADTADGSTLYEGVAGAPFRVASTTKDLLFTVASDGCGRLVALGHHGWTPAGVATGFFARPLEGATAQTALGGVTQSALAGAASGFGVLWYSRIGPPVPPPPGSEHPGELSFTTLSWQ
jgi:hypothetical protein